MQVTGAIFALMVVVVAFAACEPQRIGGDRDEGGCLIAAGYAFDEDIGACVRSWEVEEPMRSVLARAVEMKGPTYGLTIIGVEPVEGGYRVAFETLSESSSVIVS